MFKSKHSGWTYDLKRTPFGGGGGDFFSGIGDAFASIDPGPAIGQGLAEVDKTVNREIPGGWKLPAAIAIAYATGYVDPELFATEFGTALETGPGQDTFFEALSNGATSEEAMNAGIAAQTAAGGQAAASATTQALPYSEVFDATNLANQGLNASAIQQNIAATGLNDFLAQDIANMAASGLSPEAIAQNLAYSYSPTELAGTGIESLQAQSGLSAKDALTNVNRARQIANLLNQGGSQIGKNISVKNIPTQQAWQQQAAQNFITAPQEQFGGLYQMNKNPFTFQNPTAQLLSSNNKIPTGLDVSGQQGTALNTQQQNQIFSSLLRSA